MKPLVSVIAVSLIVIGFLTASTVYFYNKTRSGETAKSVSGNVMSNDSSVASTPTPPKAAEFAKPAEPKGRLSYPAYVYQLQPKESLVAVAAKMEIPWTMIKKANGITDENKIQAGQKLIIPILNNQTDLYRIEFIINEEKAATLNRELRDLESSDLYDPVKVAKSDAINYFSVQATDEYKLVEADLNQGIAYVEAKTVDYTNVIGLIQPKIKGSKGFWAVKYVERKE